MKGKKILKYQQAALKALSGKIDNFYLAGGTALALFYFQHRLSIDLDFFTPKFSSAEVRRTMEYLEKVLKVKSGLMGQTLKKDTAKIMVYNIYFAKNDSLKIDFVEDFNKLIKRPKVVDGINVLSLEDIYIRKIYALVGYVRTVDEVGRAKLIGGRSEAKDFYDIYFLSHTFMPLSKFVNRYCGIAIIEGLVRWFRAFDRMDLTDGILTLDTNKKTYYRIMENHFKKEIDKIIKKQLSSI